jgi:hypothetical protein
MLLNCALAILATYRIARMLAMEDGPFDLFAKTRELLDAKQETWIGRGVNCPLCIGFWVAGVFALLLAHDAPDMGRSGVILAWFAIAGGQTVLQMVIEK